MQQEMGLQPGYLEHNTHVQPILKSMEQ